MAAASTRSLSIIGAPTSAGAYGPGQERTPGIFREYGLVDALRDGSFDVVDRGDGRTAPWQPDEANPAAHNVDTVVAVATELADSVAAAFADGHDILVLGGDCTLEIGTVAGAVADGASVGLAYIDLDTDLNTPETGDGVLDWMGVAHLLDVPGALDGLAGLGSRRPLLDPADVRAFAAENITSAERAVVDRIGLHVEPLAAVVDEPEAVLDRTQSWAKAYDRLLVHVDIDVLDYTKFPIAHEVRDSPGLELAELTRLLRDLCGLGNWRALTVTEINPGHAPNEADSFRRLIGMLVTALGARHS